MDRQAENRGRAGADDDPLGDNRTWIGTFWAEQITDWHAPAGQLREAIHRLGLLQDQSLWMRWLGFGKHLGLQGLGSLYLANFTVANLLPCWWICFRNILVKPVLQAGGSTKGWATLLASRPLSQGSTEVARLQLVDNSWSVLEFLLLSHSFPDSWGHALHLFVVDDDVVRRLCSRVLDHFVSGVSGAAEWDTIRRARPTSTERFGGRRLRLGRQRRIGADTGGARRPSPVGEHCVTHGVVLVVAGPIWRFVNRLQRSNQTLARHSRCLRSKPQTPPVASGRVDNRWLFGSSYFFRFFFSNKKIPHTDQCVATVMVLSSQNKKCLRF